MTDIDKFYSDADRIVAKAGAPGSGGAAKLASELTRHFLVWTRDYGDVGTDMASWWMEHYAETLGTESGRKNAVEWFGSLLALLSNNFTAEMDFPDADWEEIRDTVSACADDLDMDIITTIMTVIVDRGHA
jgi:hypothetical protein